MEQAMGHQRVSDIVYIEYSHFYIAEQIESFDFSTGGPVFVHPGQITVFSRVQTHRVPVTLEVEDEPPAVDEGWEPLGSYTYRPVRDGRMTLSAPSPGASREKLQLDTGTVYSVHIYAKGRQDSLERWDATIARSDYGVDTGFEEYLAVFTPAGGQQPPAIARTDRQNVVDEKGHRPANWE
ncbi:hypothetical protein [Streptomyces sp. NPDC056821]|uniref:hypothetical protein n=1 Tax=unclassified Streptomyces TaxID=2593676 RepID=UPI0036AD2C88